MYLGHGNDLYNYPNIKIDFSSNVTPLTNHGLIAFLKDRMLDVENYPHPAALPLVKTIAKFYKLPDDMVFPSNGATEAIYKLAQVFQGKRSHIHNPAFAEYKLACTQFDHQVSESSALLPFDDYKKVDLVWINNPQNPTGILLEKTKLVALISQCPDTYFVIDEAYMEFSKQNESLIQEVGKLNNVIIIKSLTKVAGVPGLRIGYALSNKRLNAALSAVSIPWSVNQMAIHAGCYIYSHWDEFDQQIKEVHRLADPFYQQLQGIKTLQVHPSSCHFYHCKVIQGTAYALKQELATKYNMLIRDCSNFSGLDTNSFRVSTQLEDQNLELIRALRLI